MQSIRTKHSNVKTSGKGAKRYSKTWIFFYSHQFLPRLLILICVGFRFLLALTTPDLRFSPQSYPVFFFNRITSSPEHISLAEYHHLHSAIRGWCLIIITSQGPLSSLTAAHICLFTDISRYVSFWEIRQKRVATEQTEVVSELVGCVLTRANLEAT